MTPYEICILLHYYVCPYDPDHIRMDSMMWPETTTEFVRLGLLERRIEDRKHFEITDKGRSFVEDGLMQVPLPTWTVRFK